MYNILEKRVVTPKDKFLTVMETYLLSNEEQLNEGENYYKISEWVINI